MRASFIRQIRGHCASTTRAKRRVQSASVPLFLLWLVVSNASAAISFQDQSFRLGLANDLTDTWGASWGDLDSDGYPDIYVSNHFSYGRLLVNQQDGSFDEVGRAVDLDGVFSLVPGRGPTDKHAATWADLDNDGDLDLFQSVTLDRSALMTNNGGLLSATTVNARAPRMALLFDRDNNGVTEANVIGYNETACDDGTAFKRRHWAIMTDLNASGRLDVLCATSNTDFPDAISYFGSGSSVTLPRHRNTIDAIVGDLDGDLRSDLIKLIAAERPTASYLASPNLIETHLVSSGTRKVLTIRTTGAITIRDLNAAAWARYETAGERANIGTNGTQTAETFTLSPTDPANQGIAGGNGLSIGYVPAQGAWRIEFQSASFDVAHVIVETAAPITAADLQLTPLFAGTDLPQFPVYFQNSGGGLTEVTSATSGLPRVFCSTGVAADFDNDMDLDLYLGCRTSAENTANRVFENLGNGTFVEVLGHGGEGPIGGTITEQAGAADSAVTADYDLDGYIDVFVSNGENLRPERLGGPKTLLRNSGSGNRSALFDLRGRASNRDGIGAKVYISTPDGRVQYREQNGGYHKHAQNHMRLHVGLGANSVMTEVEVQWPSGNVTRYSNLDAGRAYVLDENGSASVRFQLSLDTDGDGLTNDVDPDDDNDGVPDGADAFPLDPTESRDTDNDGVGDNSDAFPNDPNETTDSDGDGVGDNSDNDRDNDGLADGTESTGQTLSGILAYAKGTDFTTLGTGDLNTASIAAVRINRPARAIQITDNDANFDSDNIVNEISDDPTQSVLVNGASRAIFHDFTLEFENAGGQRTTLLVVDVDLDGSGTADLDPEDGAYLIRVAGRQPLPGETLTRVADFAQTVSIPYSSLPEQTLALDDIDADGVNNANDLDSDNDTIPDIVEAGLIDADGDALVDNLGQQGSVFVPPDADNDGLPDYLDLESNNAANDGTAYDLATGAHSAADTNGNGRIDAGDIGGGTDADNDGIDDLVDGNPNQPGNGSGPTGGTSDACGEPLYSGSADRALFLWKDCSSGGSASSWNVRVSSGGGSFGTFQGQISADAPVPTIGTLLEASDIVDSVPGDGLVDFTLRVGGNGVDGFAFDIPAGASACFDPTRLAAGADARLGVNQLPISGPLQLEDLSACAVAPTCNEPAFDPRNDPGIYLWQDCSAGGPGRSWRVRIVAGGLSWTEFAGLLTVSAPVTAAAVSLEGADTLDSVPGDGIVDFSLFVANAGIDGFDVLIPAGANTCFNPQVLPGSAGVFVGGSAQSAAGAFNLEDLGVCQ